MQLPGALKFKLWLVRLSALFKIGGVRCWQVRLTSAGLCGVSGSCSVFLWPNKSLYAAGSGVNTPPIAWVAIEKIIVQTMTDKSISLCVAPVLLASSKLAIALLIFFF